MTFSPDGRRLLLIATGADALFSREITKNNEPLDELVLRAQVLSGHRIDSTGGTLALDSLSLSNTWRSLQDPGTARAAR